MKKYLMGMLLSLIIINPAIADNIKWGDDPAVTSNKIKIVSFHADWCGPCQKMQKITFRDSDVITKINTDFTPISVDGDQHRDWLKKYGVRVYPTQLFIKDGKIINKVEGYVSPDRFLKILNGVEEEKWTKKQPFIHLRVNHLLNLEILPK